MAIQPLSANRIFFSKGFQRSKKTGIMKIISRHRPFLVCKAAHILHLLKESELKSIARTGRLYQRRLFLWHHHIAQGRQPRKGGEIGNGQALQLQIVQAVQPSKRR